MSVDDLLASSGSASITSGTFVLGVSDADVTAPAGFGVTTLAALGMAPYLLVEVSTADDTTGSIKFLTAWGEASAVMAVAAPRQSDGPTGSCSGTKSSGTYSTNCGSMWTDMSTTYLGPVLGTPGATLRSATLNGKITTTSSSASMSGVALSGALDLSSLTDDLGLSSLALCLDAGGCDLCPGSSSRSCVPFALTGLRGDLNPSLDLTAR